MFFWSVALIIIFVSAFTEFTAYYGDNSINELMKSMPKAMLDAFSMSNLDISTMSGFYSVLFIYISLLLAVHAIIVGSNILSKEERNKTCEYILTHPVKRTSFLRSKMAAGITLCISLLIVVVISTIVATIYFEPDEKFYEYFMLLTLVYFFIQLIFFSIGFMLSAIMKNYKKSSNIALSILGFLYFLSLIQGLTENLDFLKYVTPFKYFDTQYILVNKGLEMHSVLITLFIIVTCINITFITYQDRDLLV